MWRAETARLFVAGRRKWLVPGLLGVLAVTTGLALPQLLPRSAPNPRPAPSAQAAPADSLTYTPPSWPEPPDPTAMFLRLAAGTGVVLVLCVLSLWLLRRWLRGGAGGIANGGRLRLVEALALGNRRGLYLLAVGRHQVVVGVDPSGLKSAVLLEQPFDGALQEAVGRPELLSSAA